MATVTRSYDCCTLLYREKRENIVIGVPCGAPSVSSLPRYIHPHEDSKGPQLTM